MSLSKHRLEMTLHSLTQLKCGATSNQQQQKYSMGKINAKMLPAFLQMSHTASLFVLAYVTLRMWHLLAASWFQRLTDASLLKSLLETDT